MVNRLALALLTVAIWAFALGGCGGGGDDTGVEPLPAAGSLTPSEKTPGVPEGASYDLTGDEWLKLDDLERFTAAQDYVAGHPGECEGAAADSVRDFTDSSIGTDFPLNVPIAELLAEGCAAALQSGDQSPAPSG